MTQFTIEMILKSPFEWKLKREKRNEEQDETRRNEYSKMNSLSDQLSRGLYFKLVGIYSEKRG